MVHSILMIGQSNMAGRGLLDDVEPIVNPKLKVLRNGRWPNMYSPVNNDRPFSGVSLAESFADDYSKDHDVIVGLIPCADGGASLKQWEIGGLLFDNAVFQAQLASRTSTITAVLWHQGEADCKEELYPHYEEKLIRILEEFRKILNLDNIPFLLGGLGDFLPNSKTFPYLKNYSHVNQALRHIAETRPMTAFVSAEGLESKEDNLHFNSSSLREFGHRYYQVFRRLEKKDMEFEEKPEMDSLFDAMELDASGKH